MSALVPLIHSPLTVFTVWEIGHDPDTKGDHDDARTGSAQVHSRTYRRTSPARNSPSTYIRKAKTPTLILRGEDDDTNPVGQSQALYRALKRYGVETQLVVYPGETHLPRQEKHQIDVLERMVDWFDRHLK